MIAQLNVWKQLVHANWQPPKKNHSCDGLQMAYYRNLLMGFEGLNSTRSSTRSISFQYDVVEILQQKLKPDVVNALEFYVDDVVPDNYKSLITDKQTTFKVDIVVRIKATNDPCMFILIKTPVCSINKNTKNRASGNAGEIIRLSNYPNTTVVTLDIIPTTAPVIKHNVFSYEKTNPVEPLSTLDNNLQILIRPDIPIVPGVKNKSEYASALKVYGPSSIANISDDDLTPIIDRLESMFLQDQPDTLTDEIYS